jgi:integrase
VSAFLADLGDRGLSPNTISNVYRVLANAMATAVRHRRIAATPCVGIDRKPIPRREMVVLTAVQVEQLAEAAGPDEALMRFAAYSGCRFGEIAALRAGRVDVLRAKVTIAESASEVGGQVIFQPPKTDRTRTVSLPRFVADELAPLVAGKGPDDLVFTAPAGGPLRHTRFLRFVFRPAEGRRAPGQASLPRPAPQVRRVAHRPGRPSADDR